MWDAASITVALASTYLSYFILTVCCCCDQERLVAADSLMAVASQLQSAQAALGDRLVNRTDLSPHHTPDIFFQTVKVSSFLLADMPVLLPGARLIHLGEEDTSKRH